jgi:hypothetical protein
VDDRIDIGISQCSYANEVLLGIYTDRLISDLSNRNSLTHGTADRCRLSASLLNCLFTFVFDSVDAFP